jgi:hypothetical protein
MKCVSTLHFLCRNGCVKTKGRTANRKGERQDLRIKVIVCRNFSGKMRKDIPVPKTGTRRPFSAKAACFGVGRLIRLNGILQKFTAKSKKRYVCDAGAARIRACAAKTKAVFPVINAQQGLEVLKGDEGV